MNGIFKNSHGLLLAAFALLVTTLLAFANSATKNRIAENELRQKNKIFTQIIPADLFDQDLISKEIIDPQTNQTRTYHLALLNNQPSAVILSATAPDGYSGNIDLMVGILIDGTISGVRVIKHQETPGLGDSIELRRGDWIKSFDGKNLTQPVESQWRLKKYDGEFDQFTGATITPRAVVREVKNTLLFFDRHKTELLTTSAL